jgi:hypothetical protein
MSMAETEAFAVDDEQARWPRPLFPDETSSLRRGASPRDTLLPRTNLSSGRQPTRAATPLLLR